MTVHCRRHRGRMRTSIPRSADDKVFAGVCGGLGAHLDINSNWIRLAFIISCTAPPLPLVYLLCIFLMPSARAAARAARTTPPPIPNFYSEEEALSHLDGTYDEIEARIRRLEDHVTSREYVLKRKFDDL